MMLETEAFTKVAKSRRQTPVRSSFDPAVEWAHCAEVFNRAHNQGTCGSCWAFGALGAYDGQLCIATNGGFKGMLSRGYAASCALGAGKDGCQGGLPTSVYEYLA